MFPGYPRTGAAPVALSMTGFGAAKARWRVGGRGSRSAPSTIAGSTSRPGCPASAGRRKAEMREALRREFDRGHVSVSVRWVDEVAGGPAVDWARAGAVGGGAA